jgi:hypothetical protein
MVDSQRESTGRRATAKDACHESATLHLGEALDRRQLAPGSIRKIGNSQDSPSICPIEQQFTEHNFLVLHAKLHL